MNKLEAARKLQDRTKQFAIQIIRTFSSLPKTEPARIIGRQFLRSGAAVAANYRAARRARSLADFISKLGIVLEETDETLFWLDLLADSKIVSADSSLRPVRAECSQLVKIFSGSLATAKSNR
jgi:four helix bundle protein